jgi:WD40 repeat protein
MLPIPGNSKELQVFKSVEKKLFDACFFKIKRTESQFGIRSVFYDNTNQTLLISNVSNGKIYILNLVTAKLEILDNHNATVRKVRVVGDEIISASWDNSVRVFNKHNLTLRLILTTGNMGRCPGFQVSPDYKYVYSFSYDSDVDSNAENVVRKWSLKTGRLLKEYTNTGKHFAMTRSGGVFLYKNLVGVCSDSGYLNFFNARTGKLMKSNYKPHTVFRSSVCIGDYAFLADVSGHLHKFSIKHQVFMRVIQYAHQSDLTSLSHLKKGGIEYIVSTGFDGTVKFWNFPDLNLVNEVETPWGKWSFTFIGENTLVASDLKGRLLIYDITNLKKIKPKGVVQLFANGEFVAYKDKTLGQTPIKRFFTNDLNLLSTFKCEFTEEDFMQNPDLLKPEMESSDGMGSSVTKYEEITGKQSEYILSANNSIEVFHELFKDASSALEKEFTDLRLTPLLQEKFN